MINFLFIILCLSLAIYLYFTVLFYRGIKNRTLSQSSEMPFVSVIIAARNEENNITTILTYLNNQSYPSDRYEVIVADDDSTDKTAEKIQFFANNNQNINYLKITDRNKYNSPKKNALTKAIEKSRGEILLFTDADCFVTKNWISAMVKNFTKDVDMVCGFSRTKIDNWQKAPFYQKFEYFDFIVMYFAAAGAISSGNYFSCSGQNMGYRKKAFYDVGGFSKVSHIQSGDDVNLLQLFRMNNKKVVFSFGRQSFIYTKPISDFFSSINQRIRWASNYKYQSTLNPIFFVYLTATFFVITFIYLLPIIFFPYGLSFILIKFISDYFFVKYSSKIFYIEKERIRFFPVWFFFQPIYVLIVTVLGVFEFFKWKK